LYPLHCYNNTAWFHVFTHHFSLIVFENNFIVFSIIYSNVFYHVFQIFDFVFWYQDEPEHFFKFQTASQSYKCTGVLFTKVKNIKLDVECCKKCCNAVHIIELRFCGMHHNVMASRSGKYWSIRCVSSFHSGVRSLAISCL
jgi:hypothetical protein